MSFIEELFRLFVSSWENFGGWCLSRNLSISFKSGFLNQSDVWAGGFFVVGGCPVHDGMFSSVPGLYSLDARSKSPTCVFKHFCQVSALGWEPQTYVNKFIGLKFLVVFPSDLLMYCKICGISFLFMILVIFIFSFSPSFSCSTSSLFHQIG